MSIVSLGVLGLLGAYVFLMYRVAARTALNKRTTLAYNVAERNVRSGIGGLSLASSWIWGTGLFVSGMQAYVNGWIGLAWFIVPNVLAMLVLLPFGLKLRKWHPQGLTLSGFMLNRYGPRVRSLYHLMLGGLAIMATSVNLLAGGAVFSVALGIPAAVGSLVLAVGAFLYTYRFGIRSSVGTGAVQIVLCLGLLLVAAVYVMMQVGPAQYASSIGGVDSVTGFFSENGQMIALTYGIVTAVGLLTGPIGDPTFWQRVYTYRRESMVKAFFVGAGTFALFPLLMGSFGFAAVALGLTPSGRPDFITLDVVQVVLPDWLLIAFLIVILATLLSTMNAMMISIASLMSDHTTDIEKQRPLVAVGLSIALIISVIPGNSLLAMFLVYSTLRTAHFLITTTSLAGKVWNRTGVLVGLSSGLIVGTPMAIYGNIINADWQMKLLALAVTSLVPFTIAAVWTAVKGRDSESVSELTPGEIQAAEEEARLLQDA